MNVPVSTYLSWTLLSIAIVLWAGVGYFAWVIAVGESTRVSIALDLEEKSLRQETSFRLHALVRETRDERARLEEIARVSSIEIIDSIEAVGREVGIPVLIGQVLSAPSTDSESRLHSAILIIDAEGRFADVIYVAALLESLPVPSSIDELRFELLPSKGAAGGSSQALWRLVARVQFQTTADISS